MDSNDEFITLDEALSFISSCQDEDQPPSAKVLDIHNVLILEGIDDLNNDAIRELFPTSSPKHRNKFQTWSPTTNKKKRVRSAASSSTVLQRRKKAELETLRDEVARLEGDLAQLSNSGPRNYSLAVVKDDGHLSEWKRHALLQYQQRHQSEQENRRLKEILGSQWKVFCQLQGVLHKRNVLDGMQFLRTFESPSIEGSYFSANYAAVLLDQLEEEVDGVYRNFYKFYRPCEESTVNSISQLTYNEKCNANVMEFATTTPLGWPMHAAFKNVWELLENTSDRSRKPNALETKVNLTLPLHNTASCHFHKLHFLRKYEEKDRIVVVWADLMQLTTKKLRLRSLAYSVFTPSERNPSSACVMETFLKLYVEPTSDEEVSPEDIRYGREVVLGAFGRLMRKFWQDEQNRLTEMMSNVSI
ncbi:hypothetical protein DVH05_025268 [Phytophthora capsici]|nr:hypothetical protein DVH05_025268 [Phytophthora capsici]